MRFLKPIVLVVSVGYTVLEKFKVCFSVMISACVGDVFFPFSGEEANARARAWG